jgi:hypothetical protein
MASVTARKVIDYEQMRDKFRRFNLKRETNGLALTTRIIESLPESLPVIMEGESVKYKPTMEELEYLKTEILIPHLSREGRKRLNEDLGEQQGVDINFDYPKGEKIKEYLAPGEVFAIPKSGSVARITISGLPSDYSCLPILAKIDRRLGFPDWESEKLNSS